MRQTSRAVALLLLLESAQAVGTANTLALNTSGIQIADFGTVDIINNFNAKALTAPLAKANALTNRSAAYATQLPDTWTWDVLKIKAGLYTNTATTVTTTTVGSGCMQCLNKLGVWCSTTYAYLSSEAVLQGDQTTTNYFMNVVGTPSDLLRAGGPGMDGGSCCAPKWQMTLIVGTQGVAGVMPVYDATQSAIPQSATAQTYAAAATYNAAQAPAMVETACVAAKSALVVWTTGTTWGLYGATTWDVTTTAWSSWWCSNGLYKQVKSTTAGDFKGNFNQQIASNTNQRQELAQVACPQVQAFCGYGVNSAPTTVGTNITAASTIAFKVGTALVYTGKCTWVTYAYALAPTFAVTTSKTVGLTPNWELHTMEYVTVAAAGTVDKGRLLEPTALGFNADATASVAVGNLVPVFQMPAAAFGALRTWYGAGTFSDGAGTTGGEPANWYAPGQNMAGTSTTTTPALSLQLADASTQYFGNVANIPMSVFVSDTTASTTSKVPIGSTFGTVGGTKFDLRQVRYLPASAAQNVWAAGSTLNTTYSTNVTAYTTAKGVWDAYVAILTANSKQDAFAAMFSPPKAPTVPPLPNLPWTPPAYSGYTVTSFKAQKSFLANGQTTVEFLSAAQPTSGSFWANQGAAESVGGWGSFTAQIISFRSGWGKSFGTIGFSGDAKAQLMSQVWNMAWMCTAADTTAAKQGSDKACQAAYSPGTNGADNTAAQTATAANVAGTSGGRLVVVVSLWSKGNLVNSSAAPASNTFATVQDMTITFSAKVWSTQLQALAAITAPGAPGAAATLSGIAGAQALAASAAAALAVAAALY